MRSHRRLPVLLEFVMGVVGVFGVGYFLAGKFGVAFRWFLFSALWLTLRIGLLAVTGGLACLCMGPLSVLLATLHSISLNRELRQDATHSA